MGRAKLGYSTDKGLTYYLSCISYVVLKRGQAAKWREMARLLLYILVIKESDTI